MEEARIFEDKLEILQAGEHQSGARRPLRERHVDRKHQWKDGYAEHENHHRRNQKIFHSFISFTYHLPHHRYIFTHPLPLPSTGSGHSPGGE